MSKSEVFDSIVNERRSIRVYKNDVPVPDEVMRRSLERTILSPLFLPGTGWGQYPLGH